MTSTAWNHIPYIESLKATNNNNSNKKKKLQRDLQEIACRHVNSVSANVITKFSSGKIL